MRNWRHWLGLFMLVYSLGLTFFDLWAQATFFLVLALANIHAAREMEREAPDA